MEYFNELKNSLDSVETDADQFFNKGNRPAGTRVRRAMSGVKALLAQVIRREITELKNNNKQNNKK